MVVFGTTKLTHKKVECLHVDASLVHLCNLTLRDGTRFEAVSPDVTEPKTSLSFQYMSLKFEPETTVRYSQVISSRKLTGCIGASSPARILQLNPHAIIHKASHDITRHLEYPHISHMLLSTTTETPQVAPGFALKLPKSLVPLRRDKPTNAARCRLRGPDGGVCLGHSQAPRVATRPRGCHAMPARLGRVCLVEPNLLKRSKLIQIYSKLLQLGFERSYTSCLDGKFRLWSPRQWRSACGTIPNQDGRIGRFELIKSQARR